MTTNPALLPDRKVGSTKVLSNFCEKRLNALFFCVVGYVQPRKGFIIVPMGGWLNERRIVQKRGIEMNLARNVRCFVKDRAAATWAEASGYDWAGLVFFDRTIDRPLAVRMANKGGHRASRRATAAIAMAMSYPVVWTFKGEAHRFA